MIMKKILILLVTIVIIAIAACDDSSQDSPDYKKGYSDGYAAGSDDTKGQFCQKCNDNADTDDKQDLCSDICND